LIVEYISRQFYWAIEKIEKNQGAFIQDRLAIKQSTYANFFQHMNEAHMKEFYKASKVSNNLLLFNYCASEKFLANKKEFVKKIEKNFGVIEEKEVEEFIWETNKLKENVNSYEELFNFVGLGDFAKNAYSLQYIFKEAWKNSVEQKYNKNYI